MKNSKLNAHKVVMGHSLYQFNGESSRVETKEGIEWTNNMVVQSALANELK